MVDVQIGRVLSALHNTGLDESTLVVLTSDHGEGMAAHHWVVKLGLYEEPTRVPLILSAPGTIPSGTVDRNHLASGIDILPTMCDYASVTCPDVTGISLRPFIEHPEEPGRSFLVSEIHPDPTDLAMEGRMLRTERYKYVAFSVGKNPEQLFDLETDPGEVTNLALEPAFSDHLQGHRTILARWLEQASDPFALPHTT